jgi:YebC/PmpR family DNA-binding regulatory protein
MSGHSKWANIKNRKGAQDKKRSEAFTKMAKNILTAIRVANGNSNPETNSGLKMAIEKAREVNMPRENIERLLQRFEERKANLITCRFEGFGPLGVPLVIEVETDNKNRTLGEIKLIFRNYEGNLGSEGAVAFLFDRVGEVEINAELSEENQLELIDNGAVDFEDKTILVEVPKLNLVGDWLKEKGIEVVRSEIVMRCKQPVKLASEEEVGKVLDLIDELESNDDVISVFSGFDY